MDFAPDLGLLTADDQTLLSYVIKCGDVDPSSSSALRTLLDRMKTEGATSSILNESTSRFPPALIEAILRGQIGNVRALLDAGADMKVAWKDSNTALGAACSSGRLEIVKMLIERGARRSWVTKRRPCPYHPGESQAPQTGRQLAPGD